MNLLSNTLLEPTSITHLSYGNFLSKSKVTLVAIRGSTVLHLFLQNEGSLTKVLSHEIFAQVRQIRNYRPLGSQKDLLIMTSDSGNLTLVEFFEEKDKFQLKVIFNETYFKTGCRRISPGARIEVDVKGRGIFLTANEKNKILFMNKVDHSQALLIESPVEANNENFICFDVKTLDMGYENPLFIALESDYGDPSDPNSSISTGVVTKQVSFYEMDLGLNTLSLSKIIKVDFSAYKILSFPQTSQLTCFVILFDKCMRLYDSQGNQLDE